MSALMWHNPRTLVLTGDLGRSDPERWCPGDVVSPWFSSDNRGMIVATKDDENVLILWTHGFSTDLTAFRTIMSVQPPPLEYITLNFAVEKNHDAV